MNLYLLTRPQDLPWSYDDFDSCIVAASSEDDARSIHPANYNPPEVKVCTDTPGTYDAWIPRSKVLVQLIGQTHTLPRGVVLSSFNAG